MRKKVRCKKVRRNGGGSAGVCQCVAWGMTRATGQVAARATRRELSRLTERRLLVFNTYLLLT